MGGSHTIPRGIRREEHTSSLANPVRRSFAQANEALARDAIDQFAMLRGEGTVDDQLERRKQEAVRLTDLEIASADGHLSHMLCFFLVADHSFSTTSSFLSFNQYSLQRRCTSHSFHSRTFQIGSRGLRNHEGQSYGTGNRLSSFVK